MSTLTFVGKQRALRASVLLGGRTALRARWSSPAWQRCRQIVEVVVLLLTLVLSGVVAALTVLLSGFMLVDVLPEMAGLAVPLIMRDLAFGLGLLRPLPTIWPIAVIAAVLDAALFVSTALLPCSRGERCRN